MSYLQAIVLGLVQGLTEFLPVSSTGHLVLVPSLLGWEVQDLTFDALVHLGTALAVVTTLWPEIRRLDYKYLRKILLATIPAVVIGLAWGERVETLRTPVGVASFLVLGSLLMLAGERISRNRAKRRGGGEGKVGFREALAVGGAQALALLPGISRSGVTIAAGLALGWERTLAAKFSFLLSLPVILGAGVYQLIKFPPAPSTLVYQYALGGLTAWAAGTLAIRFLLNFLKRKRLTPFIVYRLFLAFLILVLS